MANLVKFVSTDSLSFSGLESKDANTLYFISDLRTVYKGDVPYTGGIYKVVSSLPGTGEVNTLYVNSTDGSVSFWDGNAFQTVVKATSTTLSGSGDNLHFPTTKAVIDYVASQLTDLDVGELAGRVDTLEGEMDTAQGQISTIEGQIATINGSGAGSINKALQDAKDYADSLAPNYAAADHDHVLADITDAGALAGKNQVAEGDLESGLASKINGKADKATTIAGYGIQDAYTKGEVDSAISAAVANADHLKRAIVEDLPEVGEADENTIYMVGDGAGEGNQKYEEFMLINGAFEKIGDSAVELTGYATEAFVTGKIAALDYENSVSENEYVAAVSQTDGVISVQKQTLPVRSVTEGTSNGTISVNGTDVSVHGLGSAAYTNSGDYATAAQGALADSALQKSDIATGTANGSISVDGSDVAVKGLGSAAYTESSAYDAAGSADNALAQAKAYVESLLTWQTL